MNSNKRILFKRIFSFVVLPAVICVSLFGCNTEAEKTESETVTETAAPTESKKYETKKPTNSTVNLKADINIDANSKIKEPMDLINELDVNMFDLDKFLYPVWKSDTCFAESSFVRENADGVVEPLQLLYPIKEIISVRSGDMKIVYTEGVDYKITNDGKLEILEGGAIEVLPYEYYHFPGYAKLADNLATKFPAADNSGWGYIRAEIGASKPGMSKWTLSVTYKHDISEPVVTVPSDKSDNFERLLEKLNAGEDITVVSMGDSITDGWSSSAFVNRAPYCPSYNRMVCEYINGKYGVEVDHKNIAVSGSSSGAGDRNGLGKVTDACAADPDLVIVAFGMNDGCGTPADTFTSNINTIVNTIEVQCPDACIVVVGTCLPNKEVGYTAGKTLLKYHIDYAESLTKAEAEVWNNASFADVTTLHTEILERKAYQDTSGSNSNHPNDYMHRLYAQVVLSTIFGDYTAE